MLVSLAGHSVAVTELLGSEKDRGAETPAASAVPEDITNIVARRLTQNTLFIILIRKERDGRLITTY